MIEFCKKQVGSDPVSGLDHAQRVLKWCERIGEAEGADMGILRTAAILHDVGVPQGREIHHSAGAKLAKEFLHSISYPPEKIKAVTEAIIGHSRYGGPEPTTLEGWILRDADMLDFIGLVGIARAILRDFQSDNYDGNPSKIPGMIKQLKGLVNEKFHTNLGEKIAQQLFDSMNHFSEHITTEMNLISHND